MGKHKNSSGRYRNDTYDHSDMRKRGTVKPLTDNEQRAALAASSALGTCLVERNVDGASMNLARVVMYSDNGEALMPLLRDVVAELRRTHPDMFILSSDLAAALTRAARRMIHDTPDAFAAPKDASAPSVEVAA